MGMSCAALAEQPGPNAQRFDVRKLRATRDRRGCQGGVGCWFGLREEGREQPGQEIRVVRVELIESRFEPQTVDQFALMAEG